MKRYLESLPISFVLVHGNHNQRPSRKICKQVRVIDPCLSGDFLVNPDYPSIYYPMIFGHYTVLGERAYIMGGAYSKDKVFRLIKQEMGEKKWRWFYDEQMNQQERIDCWKDLHKHPEGYRYVFTHTCPLKYFPHLKIHPDADVTMEKFFDKVRETFSVKEWYCGHHHIDTWSLDRKIRFMYHDVIMLGDTEDRKEETNESESD